MRISATDWVPGGFDGDDAVALATGAQDDWAVTSSTCPPARPRSTPSPDYGRLYQTPFSDRIRREVGIPTMTVGAVSSIDDVHNILVSGRADLCVLARPHLVDPYWTLNAAIDLGYADFDFPDQYLSGLERPETSSRTRFRPTCSGAEISRLNWPPGTPLRPGPLSVTEML